MIPNIPLLNYIMPTKPSKKKELGYIPLAVKLRKMDPFITSVFNKAENFDMALLDFESLLPVMAIPIKKNGEKINETLGKSSENVKLSLLNPAKFIAIEVSIKKLSCSNLLSQYFLDNCQILVDSNYLESNYEIVDAIANHNLMTNLACTIPNDSDTSNILFEIEKMPEHTFKLLQEDEACKWLIKVSKHKANIIYSVVKTPI